MLAHLEAAILNLDWLPFDFWTDASLDWFSGFNFKSFCWINFCCLFLFLFLFFDIWY